MSWNHLICDRCWEARNPGRIAYRVIKDTGRLRNCCFCGSLHSSGIWVRQDPCTVTFCLYLDHDEE
jgi:hypothetical protein